MGPKLAKTGSFRHGLAEKKERLLSAKMRQEEEEEEERRWWWSKCVICIRTKALLYYFCLRCRNSFVFFRNENGEGYELLQDMTSFRQAKNRPESDA